MQNENSNKFSWKNKLDDKNGLSGEMLMDKNATWEKLHDRLHKKSSRIKPVWFWLAAACLLAVILTPLLTVNKESSIIVKNGLIKPGSKMPAAPPVLPEKGMTIPVITVASNEKRKIKTTIEPIHTRKIFSAADLLKDSSTVIVIDDKKDIRQNQAILPEIILENSFKAIPVVAAVKKKLKVVHINELGDPVEEVPGMVRIAYNRSSQSRFLNREVLMSSSHTVYSTGFNIFKTKNTPPN